MPTAPRGQADLVVIESMPTAPRGQADLVVIESMPTASRGQADLVVIESMPTAPRGQADLVVIESMPTASRGQADLVVMQSMPTAPRGQADLVVMQSMPTAPRGQADLVVMQSMPRNKYKWIMVKCIRAISQSSVFCDQSKANVLQKLQCSSWVSSPFLVLRQYFRVTMVLSLQPTSSQKLKTFGLLKLQFMANPVICSQGSAEQ